MNSSKYVYEYDNNGNQTQYISYTWNNGWKENQKATFEYKGVVIENGEENNSENGNGEEQGGENTSPTTVVSESVANSVNVYTLGNTIVVENATDEIRVYDAMGRIVSRDVARNVCTITVNTTGVYIVRVGNVAKRVVVN